MTRSRAAKSGCLLDAGIAIVHTLPGQFSSRLPPVQGGRLVHIDIAPVVGDDLHALVQVIDGEAEMLVHDAARRHTRLPSLIQAPYAYIGGFAASGTIPP